MCAQNENTCTVSSRAISDWTQKGAQFITQAFHREYKEIHVCGVKKLRSKNTSLVPQIAIYFHEEYNY